jgi:hypothetical protein
MREIDRVVRSIFVYKVHVHTDLLLVNKVR